jgi:hypothetical protein
VDEQTTSDAGRSNPRRPFFLNNRSLTKAKGTYSLHLEWWVPRPSSMDQMPTVELTSHLKRGSFIKFTSLWR